MTQIRINEIRPASTFMKIVISFAAALCSADTAISFKGTELIAVTVGCALIAWLFHTIKNRIIPCIPVAVGFTAALVIEKSFIFALPAIIILPVGFVISLISQRKIKRLSAVITGTAVLFSVFIGVIIFDIYKAYGAISLENIKSYYEPLTESVRELLTESFVTEIAGKQVSLINDESFNAYINVFIGMYPALLCALMTVLSVIASWLYRALLGITTGEKFVDYDYWKLEPSPITGVVFCLTVLATIIISSQDIIKLAAVDLFIIILPIMFFAGIGNQITIKKVDGVPHVSLSRSIVLIAALLIGGLPMYIILGAIFGTIDSIKRFFADSTTASPS